jgi:5-methylcytosine-specific restriction endonuclease McrA
MARLKGSTKRTPSTHCLRGHEFTPDNVYLTGEGFRYCKTCQNERVRNFSKSPKGKLKNSTWQRENAGRVRDKNNAWRSRNPGKKQESDRKRRAYKCGAKGSHTTSQFNELCKFFGSMCLRCLKHEHLTEDHVIPLSKGGSDSIENIQPLCQSCNSIKHVASTDYRTYFIPILFVLKLQHNL